ncbi:MAG: C1 family peptidase [Marmoricola sp.]
MNIRKIGACAALPWVGLALAVPAGSAHGVVARHGLGLNLAQARAQHHPLRTTAPLRAGNLPAARSLKGFALAPGDQGQVGSCVTWATGYSAYGILMKEQGITGAPMAPMYIYSQIARGVDRGTYGAAALTMETAQGIDTRSHYRQGDFDFTTQPTRSERTNAAHYKISGFTDLTGASDRITAVKSAIASGLPVVIGLRVKDSIYALNATHDVYPNTGTVVGGHEVTIVGYTHDYVTVQNSWGRAWGNGGFFRIRWSVITGADTVEVNAVGKLVRA